MGVLAYLSTALCGARTRTESVLIMVSGADTRPVGRMNSWWIFSGFFGYTFVVLNFSEWECVSGRIGTQI